MKTTAYSVLFVKDWLKFSEPDEEGFFYHMNILSKNGFKISMYEMKKLADSYHITNGRILAETYKTYFQKL